MERSPNDDQQHSGSSRESGHSNAPADDPRPSERERSAPLIPDVLEPGEEEYDRRQGGIPFGGGTPDSTFGPRSFGGGRVQVYGCTPGCLIVSLVVSVVLSILLTLLLNLMF